MSQNVLRKNDLAYPSLLKELHKAPDPLYYKGEISIINKPCIAVVGTRRCSQYGINMTEKIVSELAAYDICIVSGLAQGIDTVAHQAARENGLSTVAVLGTGIDQIFPNSNKKLAEEIEVDGLILSEYAPGTPALKYQFPERNRIISGLSLATVVVEAPKKSGALITADFALEQGREIFTLPADIDRQSFQGNLGLLQNSSAYPIASGKEIVEQLKISSTLFRLEHQGKEHTQSDFYKFKLSQMEEIIVSNLSTNRGENIEQIILKSNSPAAEVLSSLSILEIQGLIKIKNGKYYLVR